MSSQAFKPKNRHPVFEVGHPPKDQCDYPAYLFWKLQSQLTKLDYRLNRATNKDEAEPTEIRISNQP